MVNVLLVCDEMSPLGVPLFEKFWDGLKERHPNIKLMTFVVPIFKDRGSNDVFKNDHFKGWYVERKDWVEVGQSGFNFSNPPECTRFRKPQYNLLKRGYRKTFSYMPKDFFSFKPPKDRVSRHTFSILQRIGFSACLYRGRVVLLKPASSLLSDFQLVETRVGISGRSPDDIAFLHDKVDKHLSFLEEGEVTYTTMNGIIKECVKNTDKGENMGGDEFVEEDDGYFDDETDDE